MVALLFLLKNVKCLCRTSAVSFKWLETWTCFCWGQCTKIVTRPGSCVECVSHFSNARSFIKGSLCLSEGAGSICFVAEQKLSVNRTVSTSGEMFFSLLELISVLLARPAGKGAVSKPGLSLWAELSLFLGKNLLGLSLPWALCGWRALSAPGLAQLWGNRETSLGHSHPGWDLCPPRALHPIWAALHSGWALPSAQLW